MRIEVVISIWDDDLFVLRDIIREDNTHTIREQFEVAMDMIEKKLDDITERRRKIMEDDDIPF